MFWNKIKSNEYLELRKSLDNLNLKVEDLKLTLELYKNKLKKKAGIEEKNEEDDKINKGVILPETYEKR